jgi:hypothetical protein
VYGQTPTPRSRAPAPPGVNVLVVQHDPAWLTGLTAGVAAVLFTGLLLANTAGILSGLVTSAIVLPVLAAPVAVCVWADRRSATVIFRDDRILVNQ